MSRHNAQRKISADTQLSTSRPSQRAEIVHLSQARELLPQEQRAERLPVDDFEAFMQRYGMKTAGYFE